MAQDWTKLYKNYKGRWVALSSDETTVLGVGKTVLAAIKQAKAKSDQTPILTKIPVNNAPYVGVL